jgi:hypothetical protein
MPENDSRGMPSPGTPRPPFEVSDAMRGAFKGVVEHHARLNAPASSPAPSAAPIGWIIATAVSWATLIMLFLYPPAMVRTPENRTFAAPPALRVTSLRFGLWLARHRVDAFARTFARLPSHVGQAGTDDRTIILEPNGRHSYTLIARDGSVGLRLTSEMSVDSFLGKSLTELAASKAYQQAGMPGFTTAR